MSDQIETRVTRLEERVTSIRSDVTELERDVKANYVTKTELSPIAKLVYGAVAIMLMAVISAVVALVVGKGG
ncbi:hypothetical protein CCO03_08795 [Comamonas serinivorans]|uniref:DUF3618 domain-containing protein n=1 Tax=Comamonas serinivorans TaxID=1082851 RepID=A0A1Y0EM90_9BURK|nr:hypothetical protein [Comamonas serinivorans]ARU04763.1 hypothetical protein CCO03_08795 [Comamonas serinivorans]